MHMPAQEEAEMAENGEGEESGSGIRKEKSFS